MVFKIALYGKRVLVVTTNIAYFEAAIATKATVGRLCIHPKRKVPYRDGYCGDVYMQEAMKTNSKASK